jgi:GTP-binding protein YchF
MSLQLGIVGLPNSGKSTLFNALTRAGASVAAYPFTTIEPNVGVAVMSDPWLTRLAEMVNPERVVPATVEFVDIAGLVRGAHQGEGLGNQFLGHIRNVDAIVVMARCFQDMDVPHPYGHVDPVADLEVLELELALADLATGERRIDKLEQDTKALPRERRGELARLDSLAELGRALSQGQLAIDWARENDEVEWVQTLGLLTSKPRLYVANCGEEDLPDGGELADRVRAYAKKRGGEVVVISAKIEMELQEWGQEDAELYLRELGLTATGLDRLVAAGFRLLDLITFFTITGGKEVRAWPIPRDTSAPVAAGKIHTDMERGFIRAEVIPVENLLEAGSWAAARDAGQIRIEGRDYLVQDRDVIHFRFAM